MIWPIHRSNVWCNTSLCYNPRTKHTLPTSLLVLKPSPRRLKLLPGVMPSIETRDEGKKVTWRFETNTSFFCFLWVGFLLKEPNVWKINYAVFSFAKFWSEIRKRTWGLIEYRCRSSAAEVCRASLGAGVESHADERILQSEIRPGPE